MSFAEKAEFIAQDQKNQAKNNFPNILKEWIQNLKENTITGSYGISRTKAFNEFQKGNKTWKTVSSNFLFWTTRLQNITFVSLFCISGILLLLNCKLCNLPMFFLGTIVVYSILTSGVSFFQGDRFHIVLYPLILIFSSNQLFFTGLRLLRKSNWALR